MLGEVEVGAVGDALELLEVAAGEAEAVLDVDGPLGVVGELLLRVLVVAQVVGVDAEVDVPLGARCRSSTGASSSSSPGLTKYSISICSNSRVRKMKLPGVISLRKLLPIWAMPNGGFLRLRGHHVGEVEEDALRGLGPQVVQAGLVLDHAEVGLEHHVEGARLGPRAAGAAVGAGDDSLMSTVSGSSMPLLAGVLLLQVVLAEPLVAGLALGQRVAERAEVAAGLPGARRQDDARVEADHVLAAR